MTCRTISTVIVALVIRSRRKRAWVAIDWVIIGSRWAELATRAGCTGVIRLTSQCTEVLSVCSSAEDSVEAAWAGTLGTSGSGAVVILRASCFDIEGRVRVCHDASWLSWIGIRIDGVLRAVVTIGTVSLTTASTVMALSTSKTIVECVVSLNEFEASWADEVATTVTVVGGDVVYALSLASQEAGADS